jgi:hypothetical protein
MVKAEGWEGKSVVDAPVVQKLTFKVSPESNGLFTIFISNPRYGHFPHTLTSMH